MSKKKISQQQNQVYCSPFHLDVIFFVRIFHNFTFLGLSATSQCSRAQGAPPPHTHTYSNPHIVQPCVYLSLVKSCEVHLGLVRSGKVYISLVRSNNGGIFWS